MRISGINIPDNKRLEIGLTAMYGVGRPRAHEILAKAGVDFGRKPKDLSAEDEMKIKNAISEYITEGDLRREISRNIKRLKDIQSYRGTRHIKHLPARGQKTKKNTRTIRGNTRKTMGSGKKKVEKK
ncbi:30S ribosomal protein S13 [bacterium]|nr:30S ribosomal protein S13 [bacterium]MCI0565707.1 30S ribosomal protein S13 [bacterium]MCI0679974.1 30S ribosomal protein S13 [bacterium]